MHSTVMHSLMSEGIPLSHGMPLGFSVPDVAGLTQGIADMGRNMGEGTGLMSPSSGTKPSF
jgi:hypothetical protein